MLRRSRSLIYLCDLLHEFCALLASEPVWELVLFGVGVRLAPVAEDDHVSVVVLLRAAHWAEALLVEPLHRALLVEDVSTLKQTNFSRGGFI